MKLRTIFRNPRICDVKQLLLADLSYLLLRNFLLLKHPYSEAFVLVLIDERKHALYRFDLVHKRQYPQPGGLVHRSEIHVQISWHVHSNY